MDAKDVAHGNGTALIPSRTSAAWFQDFVFNAAISVLFVKHRINFLRGKEDTSYRASFSSVFAAYSKYDSDMLRDSGINGKFMVLKTS